MDARFSGGLILIIIIAVGAGLLAAQSQPRTVAAPMITVTATVLPTPQPNHVNIVANPTGSSPEAVFAPTRFLVRVGQKVTWVNLDMQAHSAVADNGAFDSGTITNGNTFSWTPTKPGTYSYGDFLHPDMHGAIQVVP